MYLGHLQQKAAYVRSARKCLQYTDLIHTFVSPLVCSYFPLIIWLEFQFTQPKRSDQLDGASRRGSQLKLVILAPTTGLNSSSHCGRCLLTIFCRNWAHKKKQNHLDLCLWWLVLGRPSIWSGIPISIPNHG